MVRWKKGKTFTKRGKRVRCIYPNGKKSGKKLVPAKKFRRRRGSSYHMRRRY